MKREKRQHLNFDCAVKLRENRRPILGGSRLERIELRATLFHFLRYKNRMIVAKELIYHQGKPESEPHAAAKVGRCLLLREKSSIFFSVQHEKRKKKTFRTGYVDDVEGKTDLISDDDGDPKTVDDVGRSSQRETRGIVHCARSIEQESG